MQKNKKNPANSNRVDRGSAAQYNCEENIVSARMVTKRIRVGSRTRLVPFCWRVESAGRGGRARKIIPCRGCPKCRGGGA